jgi:hypothetical protein
MLVFNHFFLSYYFLEFDQFIFSLQETYNNWLKERYRDDPSTYLDIDSDLWLEVGSSNGPDRNWVYRLSNTTVENLWTACGVLTIRCSQLVPSTQTPEFEAMLD